MLQGLRKGPLEGVIVMEPFSQEEKACAPVMEIEAGWLRWQIIACLHTANPRNK